MIMGITGFRLGVGCSIYEKNKMLSKPPMGGNFFDTFGNSLLFQVQNVTARLLSWPFRDRDGLVLYLIIRSVHEQSFIFAKLLAIGIREYL